MPKDQRGFLASSSWIRSRQPTSMSWGTMAKIRDRWKKPFVLKGILSLEGVRRAIDAGVDSAAAPAW